MSRAYGEGWSVEELGTCGRRRTDIFVHSAAVLYEQIVKLHCNNTGEFSKRNKSFVPLKY